MDVHQIHKVARKYIDSDVQIETVHSGSVNRTYLVKPDSNPATWLVLQHMKHTFLPTLMDDIEALTSYLEDRGTLFMPRPVRSRDGALYVENHDGWWRSLTYVLGTTIDYVGTPARARSAGALIGLFHTALLDCDHEFQFVLPGFHDTSAIIEKLERTVATCSDVWKNDMLAPLAERIMCAYKGLSGTNVELPNRIIHGDLKISNIRFDVSGMCAIALIDPDTMMRSTVAVELGDAFRSWCASGNEDDPSLRFDCDIYREALNGYMSVAAFLTREEREAIPESVLRITLELSARFLTDAYEESYFVHDVRRYATHFEQNYARAQNQFVFFEDIHRHRKEMESMIGW